MGHMDVDNRMMTFLSYALPFFFFCYVTSKSILIKRFISKTNP